ncbi:hypothetical protein Avbf_09581 [Armadillidium vulgare]|nr:hypothetical protein Avbf_09581 [Armadillidium vulgare]
MNFEVDNQKLKILYSILEDSNCNDEALRNISESEEFLLHLNPKERENQTLVTVMDAFDVYSQTSLVETPLYVVKHMITLLKCLFQKLKRDNKELDRHGDFESLAWEEEILNWCLLCKRVSSNLQELLGVCNNRFVTPTEMLLLLTDLLVSCSLPSDDKLMQDILLIINMYKTQNETNHFKNFMKKNFVDKKCLQTITKFFLSSLDHFKKRKEQLQKWGIYIVGCKLMGGRWCEGKICTTQNEDSKMIMLILKVGHSTPISSSEQVWVPVIDPTFKQETIFKALLPIDQNFSSPKELLRIILN